MSYHQPFSDTSHLYLVDGSSFLFRAFHAIPLLTRKDGLPVNAVSGFCQMLFRLTDELPQTEKPSHLAVIFDPKGGNFRHQLYPLYKANRGAPPQELIPQFSLVRRAVEAFSLLPLEVQGFEADDLIASYTKVATFAGARVTIVTSDKDLMQLVSDKVRLYDSMKNKYCVQADVIEKFGVNPDQVADVQALCGDTSDNIPGASGIGPKTAAELIIKFGSLDGVLARLEEIPQIKRRDSLLAAAPLLPIFRQLVGLSSDIPLPVPLDDLMMQDPDPRVLFPFLKALELKTLLKRMGGILGADPDLFEAGDDPAPQWKQELPSFVSDDVAEEQKAVGGVAGDHFQETLQDSNHKMIFRVGGYELPKGIYDPIDRLQYIGIETPDAFQSLLKKLETATVFGFDTETTHLTPRMAHLVGISIALAPNEAYYIPVGHTRMDDAVRQLSKETVLSLLKPFLETDHILKVGQNLKYDAGILLNEGITLRAYDDTLLMAYALEGMKHRNNLDALAYRLLGHETLSYDSVTGSGKKRIPFSEVSLEKATEYAAEDADIALRVWHILRRDIFLQKKNRLYKRVDLPLVSVTAAMEYEGISLDVPFLKKLSDSLQSQLETLEQEIYGLAGRSFLISSPKQLGDILFDTAGENATKTKIKKTATGQYATGSDILEELAGQGQILPQKLLEWRQLHKLKTTYTDALPSSVHPQTGRLHTSFSLAGTATGRLSSSEPNLQNIPIRTAEGQKIRQAFIADAGHVLVSADYSQIELRLLAHMAGIPALKEAFAKGIDIHCMTASEVFNRPLDQVTSAMRREAKTINFGIIYGQSAFGLANQLRIPQSAAKQYIEQYFAKFPEIKQYMETTKQHARDLGYVETLLGRRIDIKDIASKQASLRSFSERSAINAPIQGTAADLIRIAMNKVAIWLKEQTLKTRLVLQIHDELVLHVPENELSLVRSGIKTVMEKVYEPFLNMDVPLLVEVGYGKNWHEAHA